MRILLVGDANSIFFVHYANALKKAMDVEVHVYSPFPNKGDYATYPYDYVYFDDYELKKYSNIRYLSWFYEPYFKRQRFGRFLKRNEIKYDIIHFKWIIPAWVLCPKLYRKYTDKICLMLWGGELEHLQLLRSHRYYLAKLGRFMKTADAVISNMANQVLFDKFPFVKPIVRYGNYGSSIVEKLSQMSETREDCKAKMGIAADKITVVLGYSGKMLHNHDKILKDIVNHNGFKDVVNKLHFIFPMSRNFGQDYCDGLETVLKQNCCSYTMIKDYLSDEDVACLRKATDIMFQLSDFDNLSSSITESLCANTVLISGDWFPTYHVLKDAGFKYLEVSNREEAVDVFYKVIDNQEYYRDMVKDNKNLAMRQYSWSECIKDWVKVYKELCPES
ncbi:MAG: glycosyltransferase [Bacteroidales bacterium]|nr:glycosyltransferase [Bacteroidales bacterium]